MSFTHLISKFVVVAALFLTISSQAAHDVKVTIKGFNDADKQKVKGALVLALNRWAAEAVLNCVYDRVTRRWAVAEGEPTNVTKADLKEGGMYYFVTWTLKPAGILWPDSRFRITIEGKNLGQGINGQGQAPFTGIKNKPPQFHILLNTLNVGNRTKDQLAGTIFHEMLHNAGETHGTTGTYDQDYKGYLIKEWGLCIAGNGQPNFGLVNDQYADWSE